MSLFRIKQNHFPYSKLSYDDFLTFFLSSHFLFFCPKEPEYSDDEDFEGDEEPEERGDNRGGGGGGGGGGSNGGGYGGKSIPPIDSYHKAKNGGGGLPQIR